MSLEEATHPLARWLTDPSHTPEVADALLNMLATNTRLLEVRPDIAAAAITAEQLRFAYGQSKQTAGHRPGSTLWMLQAANQLHTWVADESGLLDTYLEHAPHTPEGLERP